MRKSLLISATVLSGLLSLLDTRPGGGAGLTQLPAAGFPIHPGPPTLKPVFRHVHGCFASLVHSRRRQPQGPR